MSAVYSKLWKGYLDLLKTQGQEEGFRTSFFLYSFKEACGLLMTQRGRQMQVAPLSLHVLVT
jgi:hypothetical protein